MLEWIFIYYIKQIYMPSFPCPVSPKDFLHWSEMPAYSLLNLLVLSNLDFLISISDSLRVRDDHLKHETGHEGEVRQGTPEWGELWSRQRESDRKILLEEMCTLCLEKSVKMRPKSWEGPVLFLCCVLVRRPLHAGLDSFQACLHPCPAILYMVCQLSSSRCVVSCFLHHPPLALRVSSLFFHPSSHLLPSPPPHAIALGTQD